MNKQKLGTFIQKRRNILNITQNDIAEYFNISTQAVSRWENGLSYPDFTLLGDLAILLKLNLDDFLNLKIDNENVNENRKFNYETFGLNIKKYQDYYKYSQKDLAKKLKVSQTSISSIENGKTYPTIKQLIKFAKIFKVKCSDLYYSNFIIYEKEIKKKINIQKPIIFFSLGALLISGTGILLSKNNKNQTSSTSISKNKDDYAYIEFWDQNDNVVNSQKLEFNKRIDDYPDRYSFLGWNQKIENAKTSMIFKSLKNPNELSLYIHFGNNTAAYYYYDKVSDFDIHQIGRFGYYCTALKYENGDVFDLEKIESGEYTLFTVEEAKRTHTITFPNYLNVEPISVMTSEVLYDLPLFYNEEYFIVGYTYNNEIIKPFSFYPYEKSIEVEPIFFDQEIEVDDNGIITYLSSNEEEIIIPDYYKDLQIKGIAPKAIHLNEINKKIKFINRYCLSFYDVFSNSSLINNIQEIEIKYAGFEKESYLGNISYLKKVSISDDDINDSNYNYELIKLSTNKDFLIDNLTLSTTTNFNYQKLNVNEVNINSDISHSSIKTNMFKDSSLKKIKLKTTNLVNSLDISDGAFYNCQNLESFEFPVRTYLSGDNHFYNCTSLKEVTFYGGINYLSNNMFYNAPLKEIIINQTVEKVKKDAFKNTSLTKIEINNINEIEDNCYLPSSLKDFYLGGTFSNAIEFTNASSSLLVHYLDYNKYGKDQLNTTSYNICVNCLHRHKGDYL